jgi:hypothetical protein
VGVVDEERVGSMTDDPGPWLPGIGRHGRFEPPEERVKDRVPHTRARDALAHHGGDPRRNEALDQGETIFFWHGNHPVREEGFEPSTSGVLTPALCR